MGHIFFIMWVSWSWKWTLINKLKTLDEFDFHIPLSYKTRPIRENETNWVDAWFISKESFFSQVQSWLFLEYAMVHWLDYYWTKYEDVIDNWLNLWKIVIKELDINWLIELRKNKPELDSSYSTIFLNIPPEVLTQRINDRWAFMSDEELQKRINSSIIEEQKALELCDYMIDATQSKTEVFEKVLEIIQKKI